MNKSNRILVVNSLKVLGLFDEQLTDEVEWIWVVGHKLLQGGQCQGGVLVDRGC